MSRQPHVQKFELRSPDKSEQDQSWAFISDLQRKVLPGEPHANHLVGAVTWIEPGGAETRESKGRKSVSVWKKDLQSQYGCNSQFLIQFLYGQRIHKYLHIKPKVTTDPELIVREPMIIIPTNHWIPLLPLSMAFLAFPFLKLSRPQLEIKEAKSRMDWNLCDNSGNQDGDTLCISSQDVKERSSRTGLANSGRKWGLFIQNIYQTLFEPLSYKWCYIDKVKGRVKEDTKVLRGLLKLPG